MAPTKALGLLSLLLLPLLSESIQICPQLMEVMNEFLTQDKSIFMDSINDYTPTPLESSTSSKLKDCVDETMTSQEGEAVYELVEQVNDRCRSIFK